MCPLLVYDVKNSAELVFRQTTSKFAVPKQRTLENHADTDLTSKFVSVEVDCTLAQGQIKLNGRKKNQ